MGEVHNLVRTHGPEKAKEMVGPDRRSVVELASEIMGHSDGNIAFLFSGFAMLNFPYRELKSIDDVWERRNGNFTMLVEPGTIPDPAGGFKKYGVPHGSRARLIMFFLQTEAVKNRSRTVSLGTSMNDWMSKMGIEGRGGWNIKQIREQAMRITACRLTVAFQAENGTNGFARRDVISGMINLPQNGSRQGWLLEETAELSEDFYRHLIDHPLPVDEKAVQLIGNSAMSIDVYVWLAYRLRNITKPTLVHRDALYSQFGSMYALPRQFWAYFKKALQTALAVYPDARVELLNDSIRLMPSAPPIAEKKVVNGTRLLT